MRCVEPAGFASIVGAVVGYERVSTPRDLAPSVLDQICLRQLRWIPLATAHTPTCWCARDRKRPLDAFEGVCQKCWLLLLPTHPMQANATGDCAGNVH
jgi:hypothetical protein